MATLKLTLTLDDTLPAEAALLAASIQLRKVANSLTVVNPAQVNIIRGPIGQSVGTWEVLTNAPTFARPGL